MTIARQYLWPFDAQATGFTVTTADADFVYDVVTAIPGVDDLEILQPRRLYTRQGRTGEHDAMVARLKQERKEFLGSFPGLDESLVKSLG